MTKNEQIEDASKTKVNTAFLIEALVLMAVLIASMAVFTQLFTHSAVAAHQAEELTRATLLAQNAAEEFSSDPAAVAAGKTVGQGVAAGNVSAVDGSDGLAVSCDVDSDAPGHAVHGAHHRERRFRRSVRARRVAIRKQGEIAWQGEPGKGCASAPSRC